MAAVATPQIGDMMKVRSFSTMVAAVMALLMMTVGAASAQEGDDADDLDFGVSCVPEDPAVGDEVTCTVVGAVPGETLDWSVSADGEVVASGQVTAGDDGTASFSFTAVLGVVLVNVAGSESGDAPATEVAAAEDAVDPDPLTVDDDDALPDTGSNTNTLLLGGLLFLLIGAGAVLGVRRKRESVDA